MEKPKDIEGLLEKPKDFDGLLEYLRTKVGKSFLDLLDLLRAKKVKMQYGEEFRYLCLRSSWCRNL